MRKLILGMVAAATVFTSTVETAYADHRHRHHNGQVIHRHVQNNYYVTHNYRRNQSDLLLGGLAAGVVIGSMFALPAYGALPPPPYYGVPIHVPTCHPALAGYGWNGYQHYPIYRQICR
jgi:hypothetical protein